MNRILQLQDQMNNDDGSIQLRSISKKVIVIGPSGSGKSTIGNMLLQKKCFKTGESTIGITEDIEVQSNNIKTKNHQNIHLTVVDTPGIADPSRRSREYLNKIMQFIKTNQIDLIIITVPYGRNDPQLQNNLMALKYCINGVQGTNTLMVINKFPMENILKNNYPPQNKEDVRQEAIKKFSQQLDLQDPHIQVFTLENGSADEKEIRQNIYQQIYFCSFGVNSECVRTWAELLQFYKDAKDKKLSEYQIREEKINRLKGQLKDIETNFTFTNFLWLTAQNAVEVAIPGVLPGIQSKVMTNKVDYKPLDSLGIKIASNSKYMRQILEMPKNFVHQTVTYSAFPYLAGGIFLAKTAYDAYNLYKLKEKRDRILKEINDIESGKVNLQLEVEKELKIYEKIDSLLEKPEGK